jgi:hypothetical protein
MKGCFDHISHGKLMDILTRKIKDERLLKLIADMLKAGYVEGWTYHATYSGTPQGGIVSPLLANILLHELDACVEDTRIPKYTRGKKRKLHDDYMKLMRQANRLKKKGEYRQSEALRKLFTHMPATVPNDSAYRRCRYVRYADDCILGYIGTKEEAHLGTQESGNFLKTINLDRSEEKTVITHAETDTARFLNYHVSAIQENSKRTTGRNGVTKRSVNAHIRLAIPDDVFSKWKAKVHQGKKPSHRNGLLHLSDDEIIQTYETE